MNNLGTDTDRRSRTSVDYRSKIKLCPTELKAFFCIFKKQDSIQIQTFSMLKSVTVDYRSKIKLCSTELKAFSSFLKSKIPFKSKRSACSSKLLHLKKTITWL